MNVRLSILALVNTLSIALLLALNLAACSAAPRSASYFQGHSKDAKAVVVACRTGSMRGAECLDAQAGIAAAARDARMATYRKSF